MILKEWAKTQGISYRTAIRWYHTGCMPVPAKQIVPNGAILVNEATFVPKPQCGVHLYARVSSHDQKEDLQRQLQRLRDYAACNGLEILSEVTEIGSGLNGRRIKLQRILRGQGNILVEHSDRLARFGVPYLEAVLEASGRKLYVLNKTESKVDLVQDFVDVVTSMCARIYGKRSAKNKAQRALKAINED